VNLIFIVMDGARVDHIVNGTNYSKLIEKSLFFPKVITYAPYTIAALHAVFTGTYGNKTGVNSYWSSPNFQKEQFKTLPSYLHDNGYVTYGDVINKLVLPKIGFDDLVIHDELKDNLTERHIDLLNKVDDIKKQGKKFFLYLHYSNIHTGIMENVLKKYNNFSEEYFSNKDENKKYYSQLFDKADQYLGNIIQHAEDLKLTEDTLIIVISDHGISIGEKFGERAYGVFCYDYTLISTALFYSKHIKQQQIRQQVRSIDILPTILEILSISQDLNYKKMDGQSLLSIVNGSKESRLAFSQSGNPLGNDKPPKEPNIYAVRTDEWKYIKNIHDGTEELYDLKNDPNENDNVIAQYKNKADELRTEMTRIVNPNDLKH